MDILNRIHGHSDLVSLNESERICLCQQIRDFLVESVSKTGGHLASNLGVVELTVALETVFDTSVDRLVFDVGHQSYVHKLLTGRRGAFSTLRQFGGLSGFPKPSESVCDAFIAGHSASSVSIALGMARARRITNESYNVIALLGDGAATGGMVYEGLNDAAVSNEPLIVILNDNEMSIDRNVGGMASHLSKLRTKEKYLGMKKTYRSFLTHIPGGRFVLRITRKIKDMVRRMLIPETIFESMGFTYLGPVDGHDTENLISLLRIAREMNRPVLLHVLTQKGRGYEPAVTQPEIFHGVSRFDPQTGALPSGKKITFSDAFGSTMCKLAEREPKLCAITAAMLTGTGLLEFKNRFPKRLFDVGIAEEHAMSMTGGLAKQGAVPVIALYSTFLQRAYDMILQDICMQKLHVVLAVDRAGLVGEDGETHHGVFDVGFLRQAPGMKILCPANTAELRLMLEYAVWECDGPVAIRYPRGGDGTYTEPKWSPAMPVVSHANGKDCAIITYGRLINNALRAAEMLFEAGISVSVLRLGQINPIPLKELCDALGDIDHALIVEETCNGSGIYQDIASVIQDRCRIWHIDLGPWYPTHGTVDQLYHHYGLDACSIADYIQEVLKDES